MEILTTIFDCGLYLTGLLMALVVALVIVVAGYELALTYVKRATFARKIRRRIDVHYRHPSPGGEQ